MGKRPGAQNEKSWRLSFLDIASKHGRFGRLSRNRDIKQETLDEQQNTREQLEASNMEGLDDPGLQEEEEEEEGGVGEVILPRWRK